MHPKRVIYSKFAFRFVFIRMYLKETNKKGHPTLIGISAFGNIDLAMGLALERANVLSSRPDDSPHRGRGNLHDDGLKSRLIGDGLVDQDFGQLRVLGGARDGEEPLSCGGN